MFIPTRIKFLDVFIKKYENDQLSQFTIKAKELIKNSFTEFIILSLLSNSNWLHSEIFLNSFLFVNT